MLNEGGGGGGGGNKEIVCSYSSRSIDTEKINVTILSNQTRAAANNYFCHYSIFQI